MHNIAKPSVFSKRLVLFMAKQMSSRTKEVHLKADGYVNGHNSHRNINCRNCDPGLFLSPVQIECLCTTIGLETQLFLPQFFEACSGQGDAHAPTRRLQGWTRGGPLWSALDRSLLHIEWRLLAEVVKQWPLKSQQHNYFVMIDV